MKVLMICTEKLPVPPVLGGAIQTYISGSLPFLRDAHDITVLGVNDPSLPEEETIDGVRYVRIPGKIFEVYRSEVTRYLQENTFDLIHIFNRPRLVLPIRAVAPKAKLTLSMHNDMFNPEKIDNDEAEAAIDEISRIVTVSDYVGNVIKELYPKAASKVRTIYSGVDTEVFFPGHDSKMKQIRNSLRKEHGLENKTVLLFAGRLSRNKGVDRLVRAIPELSKKYKNLALVIVGGKWFSQDGITDFIAYVRALAKRLPIPVVTTGFVAPNKIQNWYAAADLFVCTSIWQEPLARVHYEAMAAGLPIVTTARGGNAEVILPGENGFVVENPEDPHHFAEKISEILSNKTLMKRMGQKGRELAETKYTFKNVGKAILEVWDQSMNRTVASASEEMVLVKEMKEHSEGIVVNKQEKTKAAEQVKGSKRDKTEAKESKVKPIELEELIGNEHEKEEVHAYVYEVNDVNNVRLFLNDISNFKKHSRSSRSHSRSQKINARDDQEQKKIYRPQRNQNRQKQQGKSKDPTKKSNRYWLRWEES